MDAKQGATAGAVMKLAVGEAWDAHVHVFDAARPGRAGHYTPATRTLESLEQLAAPEGVGHVVLVQPSVYGSDASLMLEALARSGGRHRGVSVVEDELDDATSIQAPTHWQAQQAMGVRGVRWNLVSPVGDGSSPIELAKRWRWRAPRLRALAWHQQWYVPAQHLPQVLALHQQAQDEWGAPVIAVLDHLGGLRLDQSAEVHAAAWQALAGLAALGAWMKLSALYRLGMPGAALRRRDAAELAPIHALVQRVADLFEDRLVWGSDWPHTGVPEANLPGYADTFHPLVVALGQARAQAIRLAAARLYA